MKRSSNSELSISRLLICQRTERILSYYVYTVIYAKGGLLESYSVSPWQPSALGSSGLSRTRGSFALCYLIYIVRRCPSSWIQVQCLVETLGV